jgi:hypothetical protein
MLKRINDELKRLDALDAEATLDENFEPNAGTLLKIQIEDSYWHLLPNTFLELLVKLPDGVGSEVIRQTIEAEASFVWHGPSPKDSRDTST